MENVIKAEAVRPSDGVLVAVEVASDVVVSPTGVVAAGSVCTSSSEFESELA